MRLTLACTVLALLLGAGPAGADAARANARRDAPMVRELEALYNASMQAASRGDLEAYWALQTAASRTRRPALDSAHLQLLAGLLPALKNLDFVRLDQAGKATRALYRWRRNGPNQHAIIVYRQEQGRWRIDDVSVRRSGGAPSVAGARRPGPPPSAAASAPGLDPRTQDLPRTGESDGEDASRSLSPPRL